MSLKILVKESTESGGKEPKTVLNYVPLYNNSNTKTSNT